jgi:signal transduction histidine kinase
MSVVGWWWAVAASGLAALLVLRLRLAAVRAARAGHEVRGPLCAAMLGIERLDRDGSDLTTLAAVEAELRRAALALEDLDARRRPERREPVDLGELLSASSPGWTVLAGAHGARLTVRADGGRLLVDGDAMRLAQACGNLVANAIEHGGGEVQVRARALGAAVRVEVTDGGPGLPAPVSTLVADARRRRGRRGHGLAVASQVARRHGGRLAAGPSPSGARLVLELPAAGAAARGTGP